jgi:uncharacterized protein with HEPN domain
MRKRVYWDYVKDISDSIEDAQEFVKGYTFEDFKNDKKTIYAVIRAIEVIGEATKKIPRSIRDKYPDIPWKDMAGMRDKLIHEYFGVDVEVLWKTAQQDLPTLRVLISEVMGELED